MDGKKIIEEIISKLSDLNENVLKIIISQVTECINDGYKISFEDSNGKRKIILNKNNEYTTSEDKKVTIVSDLTLTINQRGELNIEKGIVSENHPTQFSTNGRLTPSVLDTLYTSSTFSTNGIETERATYSDQFYDYDRILNPYAAIYRPSQPYMITSSTVLNNPSLTLLRRSVDTPAIANCYEQKLAENGTIISDESVLFVGNGEHPEFMRERFSGSRAVFLQRDNSTKELLPVDYNINESIDEQVSRVKEQMARENNSFVEGLRTTRPDIYETIKQEDIQSISI